MRSSRLVPLFLTVATAAVAAGYAPPKLVCRLPAQITEASGLAPSSRSDDYVFLHNDSGDRPAIYTVSLKGALLATTRLKGAASVDWEDMARGPGGTLYVGDIGDNLRKRPTVTVYRCAEPVPGNGAPAEIPATRFELKYADGPHDAECLLVHPRTGQVVIVSKAADGSGVYVSAGPLREGGVNTLKRVATVQFGKLPVTIREAKDFFGCTLATGGAFAPDGNRLVIRTYTDAYEWTIKGELAAAFKAKPRHVPLPATPQGEAITYRRDGKALLLTTEGKNAPVHELLAK